MTVLAPWFARGRSRPETLYRVSLVSAPPGGEPFGAPIAGGGGKAPAPPAPPPPAKPPKGVSMTPEADEGKALERALREVQKGAREEARETSGLSQALHWAQSKGGAGGGPPSRGVVPGTGGGGGEGDPRLAAYEAQLWVLLQKAWVLPRSADPGLSAAVEVEVASDGRILTHRMTQPSGDGSFDASVERAIRKFDRFPAPPPGVTGVEVRFHQEGP